MRLLWMHRVYPGETFRQRHRCSPGQDDALGRAGDRLQSRFQPNYCRVDTGFAICAGSGRVSRQVDGPGVERTLVRA